jgi:hypothetical protein
VAVTIWLLKDQQTDADARGREGLSGGGHGAAWTCRGVSVSAPIIGPAAAVSVYRPRGEDRRGREQAPQEHDVQHSAETVCPSPAAPRRAWCAGDLMTRLHKDYIYRALKDL